MTGLHITQIGQGRVAPTESGHRLTIPPVSADAYHDAQISTYADRRDFRHTAPCRLHLRARLEGTISGTAGFGFWNHPFMPGQRGFRPPKAAWFFYGSPPNEMPLARDVPGSGWKCATIDAANPFFLTLAPLAPVGFLLMRVPSLYRRLWPVGQRALKVSEHLIGAAIPTTAHDYALEWRHDGVTFRIDGATVHESNVAPAGKMGFIAWVDNQYAVVTPGGRFGFGLLDAPSTATLVIEDVRLG